MTIVVVSFYKFVRLGDLLAQKEALWRLCEESQIKGTILLAEEGINATIAGTRPSIDRLLSYLRSDHRFANLIVKESLAQSVPFARLKLKLKPEIVTLGMPEIDPCDRVGIYVDPQDWNQLISDPDVIMIDTRNHYEVALGTFPGAINPHTQAFRQFPHYVRHHLNPQNHLKVALFCTGGIRCEKATSLLLAQGFKQVYHLQGGILNYLELVAPDASLWEGDCFVFDERVALQADLVAGDYELCRGCGYPLGDEERRSPLYRAGVCCPHCHNLHPAISAQET